MSSFLDNLLTQRLEMIDKWWCTFEKSEDHFGRLYTVYGYTYFSLLTFFKKTASVLSVTLRKIGTHCQSPVYKSLLMESSKPVG